MSCPNCGSWAVKADRSLGGRMVCGRCGEPLGAKVIPMRRPGRRRRWPAADQGPRLWWLGLMALVGLSGVLAALQVEELPRQPPRDRRGLEQRMRRDMVWRQGGGVAAIGGATGHQARVG